MDTSTTTHQQGLALAKAGRFKEALPYLLAAQAKTPHDLALHNHLGTTYQHLGDFELALRHYQEALRLAPYHPYTLGNLGTCYYRKGAYREAQVYLQQAIRLEPDFLAAHLNLGHTCVQLSELGAARTAYEQVLRLQPAHVDAAHNLAMLYIDQGQLEKALPLLEQTLAVRPDPEGFYHLGVILVSQGNFLAARKAYEAALAQKPYHDKAAHNLAQVLLSLGLKEEAAVFFKQAFDLNPDNLTAKHMLAALDPSRQAPERAERGFVSSLFDQYAATYNEHLLNTLDYQVPALLREALTPYLRHTPWSVMDLGCGSGLCAPYMTDIAAKLYGIDLSPQMLFQAKQLGAYYRLLEGDILEELAHFQQEFALVIAADVLVYFGALLSLFSKVHDSLKPSGLFAFSCEKNIANTSYLLQTSGRYAHHQGYLKSCAEQFGWTILELKEVQLRMQEGLAVMGWLMVTQKN